MSATASHWNSVFESKPPEAHPWHEKEDSLSIRLALQYLSIGEPFIDIGGGASLFAKSLIRQGIGPASVLDISSAALRQQRQTLGEGPVLIEADVTRWRHEPSYSLWHDRAVFHFLTEPAAQSGYVAALTAALTPGGHAIIATFAPDGPETCSGLPVARYSPATLARKLELLAPGQFRLIEHHAHQHVTPKGGRQQFQYSVFRREI